MKGKDFDWQTNEFMLYCRTTQLRGIPFFANDKQRILPNKRYSILILFHISPGIVSASWLHFF